VCICAVFGLTLIRPGRYALQNTIARTKAEIVVTYPKVGKTPYRPADPLQVEATKDGFGEPTFHARPRSGHGLSVPDRVADPDRPRRARRWSQA